MSTVSSVPKPFMAFCNCRAAYSLGRSRRAKAVFSKFPLSSLLSTSSKSCRERRADDCGVTGRGGERHPTSLYEFQGQGTCSRPQKLLDIEDNGHYNYPFISPLPLNLAERHLAQGCRARPKMNYNSKNIYRTFQSYESFSQRSSTQLCKSGRQTVLSPPNKLQKMKNLPQTFSQKRLNNFHYWLVFFFLYMGEQQDLCHRVMGESESMKNSALCSNSKSIHGNIYYARILLFHPEKNFLRKHKSTVPLIIPLSSGLGRKSWTLLYKGICCDQRGMRYHAPVPTVASATTASCEGRTASRLYSLDPLRYLKYTFPAQIANAQDCREAAAPLSFDPQA